LSGDYPHISYYDATGGNLKYAYKDATGWHIETVDSDGDVGIFTSIALDDDDYPHISYGEYIDKATSNLKYAYQDAGGWHIETAVSGGNVGLYTSIAVGALLIRAHTRFFLA